MKMWTVGCRLLTVSALSIFAAAMMMLVAAEPRSGKWNAVREKHKDMFFFCALCGTGEDLEVHHVIPVHFDKSLELEPNNLVTLCRHCHFEAGHLGNWNRENTNLLEVIRGVGERLHQLRTNETYGVYSEKTE